MNGYMPSSKYLCLYDLGRIFAALLNKRIEVFLRFDHSTNQWVDREPDMNALFEG